MARPRWWNGWTAAVLLAVLHAAMALSAAADKGVTYDELSRMAAGAVLIETNDRRLQPENGLVAQTLVGLGLHAGGAKLPYLAGEDWRRSDMWALGHTMLFESGNDTAALLRSARTPIALLSAVLTLLVYAWSRRLFGPAGGLVSATAAAFSPTLLAHGALATSDVVAATAFLLATWALARAIRAPGPWSVLVSGLATGLLFLSKVSAVLIVPVALVLALHACFAAEPPVLSWRWNSVRVTAFGRRARLYAVIALAHVLIVVLVIWAAHGFRYHTFEQDGLKQSTYYYGDWSHITAIDSAGARLTHRLAEHRLLPEPWLYGVGLVFAHGAGRASFLDGEFSVTGFPSFFPKAFLYKTPLALMALLLVALLAVRWTRRTVHDDDLVPRTVRPGLVAALPLWLLLAVYWAAALSSNLNIGHRHLLPVYPPLFVLAGAAGHWLSSESRARALSVALLLAWLAGSSWVARPDYLAYFNPIAGGPDNGYRRLVDSSLDWGQELPGLAAWLKSDAVDPDAPVFLSYFGKDIPQRVGIEARHLPWVPDTHRTVEPYPLTAGLYCISATMLQTVYLPVRAPWNPDDEARWQAAEADILRLEESQSDPARWNALLAERGDAWWNARLAEYELLRFGRLCAWLRAREPDHQVGHAILVYRLTQDEVDRALHGPPVELVRPGEVSRR
jgi:4-amino-4-deoxy-L-arabinose transferase-like glycosyltransferase